MVSKNLSVQSNAENQNNSVRLNQVLRAPDKNNWITAMEEELQAFKENDAWAVVSEVPQGKTLVQLADRDIVQLLAALEDGNISEDGLEDESEDKETFTLMQEK
ncbi:hypothetical protein EVAR_87748_1 [Eumeta japonica]|uniref:Retrovirus-related Pol polyprotein from transposon TNT 1-94 n=1 Tax=Eumeta variegata TaxID=151549 RepID=A0A4C1ZKE5_EUMVA|nr:hypothetical protein EVAR_87748_1 [Eumeta japonica]